MNERKMLAVIGDELGVRRCMGFYASQIDEWTAADGKPVFVSVEDGVITLDFGESWYGAASAPDMHIPLADPMLLEKVRAALGYAD